MMTTKKIMVWLLLFAGGLAHAGSSSVIVVIASGEGSRVAATIRQRADFVAAPISLRSNKSDAAERFAAVAGAKSYLESEISKQKGWSIYEGSVSLSGRSNSRFGSSYGGQAQPDLTILVPLTDASDIFSISATVMRFVAQQSFPAKVEASIGNFALGIREPQQYRPQLLKIIAEDAVRTRDTIASSARMRLEGLEGPVMVRQLNGHEVELFIDYRLAIEKNDAPMSGRGLNGAGNRDKPIRQRAPSEPDNS